jgi:hypothetical protein
MFIIDGIVSVIENFLKFIWYYLELGFAGIVASIGVMVIVLFIGLIAEGIKRAYKFIFEPRSK